MKNMRRNEEESSPRREAGVGVAWGRGGGPASGVRRRLASGRRGGAGVEQ